MAKSTHPKPPAPPYLGLLAAGCACLGVVPEVGVGALGGGDRAVRIGDGPQDKRSVGGAPSVAARGRGLRRAAATPVAAAAARYLVRSTVALQAVY